MVSKPSAGWYFFARLADGRQNIDIARTGRLSPTPQRGGALVMVGKVPSPLIRTKHRHNPIWPTIAKTSARWGFGDHQPAEEKRVRLATVSHTTNGRGFGDHQHFLAKARFCLLGRLVQFRNATALLYSLKGGYFVPP